MWECLAVGLGGCLGSVLRYLLGQIPLVKQNTFPANTLLINLLGCFAIGLVAAWAGRGNTIPPRLLLFIKVGIIGGFTTFSTFVLEAFGLFESRNGLLAVLYILLSVIGGLLAAWGGSALGRA